MRAHAFTFISILSSGMLFGQSDKLQKQIDSIVAAGKDKYGIVGISVSVVKGDTFSYTTNSGYSDLNTREPVTGTSVFHSASLSKLFTATAIVGLAEQKYFKLDDLISLLIPEFHLADEQYKKITVRQLLNHTSGMPDVVNYYWATSHAPNALKNYVLSLKTKKLNSNPGEHFLYSSMGYEVLGYLIEKTTGEAFDTYMKREFLEPAGMVNSTFNYHEVPTTSRTAPHSRRLISKNIYRRDVYPYNPAHAPSSTLNSSADDLSKWMQVVLRSLSTNGQIKNVSDSSLRSMLLPSERFKFIGLGWFKGKLEENDIFFHFGGDKGFRSYLIIIPKHEVGLVLLANCDYDEDFRQYILHGIARVVLENKLIDE